MRIYSGQRIPLTVLVDGQDVTHRLTDLQFSNADPGGFEMCSLMLPDGSLVRKGARITILDGIQVAWDGRVGEVERTITLGAIPLTVHGEGYGAALKDNVYSMVYIDRDLTRWAPGSIAQQAALAGAGYNPSATSFQVGPDQTGTPGLVASTTGQMQKPISRAVYDSGSGNTVARVRVPAIDYVTLGSGDANLGLYLLFWTDDNGGNQISSGNVRGQASVDTSPSTPQRFAVLDWRYETGPSGTEGVNYAIRWKGVSVLGGHGLALRGSTNTSDGFYPSDIARHALAQTKGVARGTIVDATGLIVPHYAQYAPVTPEQVVADMAKLTGWHWGTWEPQGAFDTTPRFDFRPPPRSYTAIVTSGECTGLSLADRLSGYYDTAKVHYTDAAGTPSIATVTTTAAALRDAGITRTLSLDMGVGSTGAAQAFGNFILQLTNRAARAAGTVTLPHLVRLPGGGVKPSYMLQAGRDRLRITDLPGINRPLIDDTGLDVFHVKRVDVTTDQTGMPVTRVEFDEGANLIEVLQARLSLATKIAGG